MNYQNKNILVTGGTGSFGKHFTEYMLSNHKIKRLIIYSRDEFKQDNMRKDLNLKYGEDFIDTHVRFFIGDVRDKDRLYRAFNGVNYVVHAAALKQVPACEYNPFEAIKTNINGAQNVIDAALDRGIKCVIALSTDKAVNPINLYGGTKLVSDKLFCAANSYSGLSGTRFAVVRYGNVAGSRGSVIPFFKQLVETGEKDLPVTDVRMTRFWMTLDDAVNLVLEAFNKASGGEIFVYKNPSFKITDLAKVLSPDGKIREVGIRVGEKIHESMITKDDSRSTYEYDKYYIIYPQYQWWDKKQLIPGGKIVEKDWEYSSGTNKMWLTVDELAKRIEKLSK